MKICKHICFFYQESRIQYISRIINEASKYPYPTDIFIHTNKIFPLTQFTKHDTVTVHLIGHHFTDSHPFLLPWKCRDLMKTQKDAYDIFIYAEDDILIPVNAIKYWQTYKEKVYPERLSIGFVRIEVNSIGEEYLTDFVDKDFYSAQLKNTVIQIKGKDDLYVINDVNTYAAFFMYDKQDFAKFVESSFYDLPDLSGEDPPSVLIRGYHIREAAAIGADGMYDHPNNWYIHTIIPISPSNQLHPDCRVYHMANNYVNDPYTFSASVRFDEAICWGPTNFCHPGMALARKRQNLQAAANPAN